MAFVDESYALSEDIHVDVRLSVSAQTCASALKMYYVTQVHGVTVYHNSIQFLLSLSDCEFCDNHSNMD